MLEGGKSKSRTKSKSGKKSANKHHKTHSHQSPKRLVRSPDEDVLKRITRNMTPRPAPWLKDADEVNFLNKKPVDKGNIAKLAKSIDNTLDDSDDDFQDAVESDNVTSKPSSLASYFWPPNYFKSKQSVLVKEEDVSKVIDAELVADKNIERLNEMLGEKISQLDGDAESTGKMTRLYGYAKKLATIAVSAPLAIYGTSFIYAYASNGYDLTLALEQTQPQLQALAEKLAVQASTIGPMIQDLLVSVGLKQAAETSFLTKISALLQASVGGSTGKSKRRQSLKKSKMPTKSKKGKSKSKKGNSKKALKKHSKKRVAVK